MLLDGVVGAVDDDLLGLLRQKLLKRHCGIVALSGNLRALASERDLQLLDHLKEVELTLHRALEDHARDEHAVDLVGALEDAVDAAVAVDALRSEEQRLNSSHVRISYAVFCLKKKKKKKKT